MSTPDTPSRDEIRDLVKECGLDWHRGFSLLFAGDDTNRYEVLVRAALAAQSEQFCAAIKAADDKPAPVAYIDPRQLAHGSASMHCIARPEYMSWADAEAGVEYVPVCTVESARAALAAQAEKHAAEVESLVTANATISFRLDHVVPELLALRAENDKLRAQPALTDEQIAQLWSPHPGGEIRRPILGWAKVLDFARAVERAVRGQP